jgi:predicted DNA-binding transcriptional regulator AlpA
MLNTTPPEQFFTVTDIVTMLSISRRTLERMRSSGEFPPPTFIMGRYPRWSESTVSQWVLSKSGSSTEYPVL